MFLQQAVTWSCDKSVSHIYYILYAIKTIIELVHTPTFAIEFLSFTLTGFNVVVVFFFGSAWLDFTALVVLYHLISVHFEHYGSPYLHTIPKIQKYPYFIINMKDMSRWISLLIRVVEIQEEDI